MSDTQIIPKYIFQTHKSSSYLQTKPKLLLATQSWKKYTNNNYGFKYLFFDNATCENFMRTNFYGKIYDAYCRLPMGVMKADLWRYCVIYRYGGIYADVDTICKINPNIFINNSFLTIGPENSDHLCQWTFSAPPMSPILKSIIDLSVDRILTIPVITGEHNIHYLTGPGCFTDGIEMYLQSNNLPTFKDKTQYARYSHYSLNVFNSDNFHNKFIKHLFTGSDFDGWTKERDEKLK